MEADPAASRREVLLAEKLRRVEERLAARLQERAKTGLLAFTRRNIPAYQAGWVHLDVAARLERFSAAVAAGESPRMILTMPPAHGKTELAGREWPVWHMGRNPGHRVAYATYGGDLSESVSRDARRYAEAAARLWPHMAASDKWGVGEWTTVGGNGLISSAVGGPLTGRHVHALVLDDLIKNAEWAYSAIRRDWVWSWVLTTAYTRLLPGGGVLVMHTRWHEDDPIGRILRESEEPWEVVNYPAIAEEDEAHRKAGEALHPERYDVEALLRIKAAIGSRHWSALYQQRPAPAEGGIFRREWMRHYDTLDLRNLTGMAITVDATFKASTTSDYVVAQVWGHIGLRQFWLLDQVRARMTYTETKTALRALKAKWPRATEMVIEEAANGAALLNELGSEFAGVVPYKPTASKEARAQVAAVLFEAGNVMLPSTRIAPWVQDYVEELCSFPAAPHDDQVDATTQLLLRWSNDLPVVQFGRLDGRRRVGMR